MRTSWAVEFWSEGGELCHRSSLEPDWQQATVSARFDGIRKGVLPPLVSSDCAEVQPVWSRELGEPYVESIRLGVQAPDGTGPRYESTVSTGYLLRQIRAVMGQLAEDGKLERGSRVIPRVLVVDENEIEEAELRGGFSIEEIPQPLDFVDSSIETYLARSKPVDATDLNAGDFKIFLPEHLFEEAEAIARAAGTQETGGFLVGHLHRDVASGDYFSVATDQIPAEHTVAEATRLTFTPDSWAAGEAALESRGRDEKLVGWWHFHPDFCRNCPPERRETCTLDAGFFSGEDVLLHTNCWAMADQFALLLSAKEGGVLQRACFGWRAGSVVARGYHLMT